MKVSTFKKSKISLDARPSKLRDRLIEKIDREKLDNIYKSDLNQQNLQSLSSSHIRSARKTYGMVEISLSPEQLADMDISYVIP